MEYRKTLIKDIDELKKGMIVLDRDEDFCRIDSIYTDDYDGERIEFTYADSLENLEDCPHNDDLVIEEFESQISDGVLFKIDEKLTWKQRLE